MMYVYIYIYLYLIYYFTWGVYFYHWFAGKKLSKKNGKSKYLQK